jgi:hypothetical protein
LSILPCISPIISILIVLSIHARNEKAEGLGKVKRKPTKKVKTTAQILPFKNGTAFAHSLKVATG